VYAITNAGAEDVQRAMARNQVRSLFVIRAEEAAATVDILDLALHADALTEAARGSDKSDPMPQGLANAVRHVPGNDWDVSIHYYAYGFVISCSGRLGLLLQTSSGATLSTASLGDRCLSTSTAATSSPSQRRAWRRCRTRLGAVTRREPPTRFPSTQGARALHFGRLLGAE